MKTTIYRAAEKNIKVMNCGSFYSEALDIAENYQDTNDVIYEVDVDIWLKDVSDDIWFGDWDEGLRTIFEKLEEKGIETKEIYDKYDGFSKICGHFNHVIIFGRVNVETGTIEKIPFEEMLKEDELIEIIK